MIRDDVVMFEANRTNPLAGAPPRQMPGVANFDGFVNHSDLQPELMVIPESVWMTSTQLLPIAKIKCQGEPLIGIWI